MIKTCGWCNFYKPYPSGGHSFPNGYWIGNGQCKKHKRTTVVGDSCGDWKKNKGAGR